MSRRIILGVDELSVDRCLALVSAVSKRVHAIKIHNLFDAYGSGIIQKFYRLGVDRVWVDAKLYDTRNSVRLRAKAIADAGATILSVHASGGIEMMAAARKAFPSDIYAVTVLTSFSEREARTLHGRSSMDTVLYLAKLAKLAGMTGVVCSSHEAEMLAKDSELQGLKLIIPGVRSLGEDPQDQKRVATPGDALRAGADYVVVGRQITQAKDPIAAFDAVEAELIQAEKEIHHAAKQ